MAVFKKVSLKNVNVLDFKRKQLTTRAIVMTASKIFPLSEIYLRQPKAQILTACSRV